MAAGITKKALRNMDSTPETVTSEEMQKALKSHIGPALLGFMSPDKAKGLVRRLVKEVMVVI